MSNKICVIGGDLRFTAVAKEFANAGYEVAAYGMEKYKGDFGNVTKAADLEGALTDAGVVILPLPCTSDKINVNAPLSDNTIVLRDVFSMTDENAAICGGMMGKYMLLPNVFDYYEREELKILNAVPSAEGAIGIAINELPYTLHGAETMIVGFGRIGKVLAHSLKGLGAHVTVISKKSSDLAWCEVHGYSAANIAELPKEASNADVIFNTVPAQIINADVLKYVKRDVLIIDLATKPGGVDFDAAKRRNVNVLWALSLPGKTAPISAGKIIKKAIVNILEQREVDSI